MDLNRTLKQVRAAMDRLALADAEHKAREHELKAGKTERGEIAPAINRWAA